MLELGQGADELHTEMGAYARSAGVNRLFAVGSRARFAAEEFGTGAEWFGNVDALIAHVQSLLSPSVTVLIKGSRGMRLERVTAALSVGTAAVVNGH
jgi:UDP-N-acetylmuramoyl-tripeptide--D-alanyl-D-alanine ligase